MEKFFAVHKTPDGVFELWSDACNSYDGAMGQAELRLLDTYGSRSKDYTWRINRLFTINDKEAHYLGLVKESFATPEWRQPDVDGTGLQKN